MSNFTNEEVGFGDVQTDEEKSPKAKGAVVPTVHPTPLPRAANPVPPPLPKLPPAPNAADIMPPLPPMPSIVDNPVNQENAKTVGGYGAGAAGVAALIASLPYLYNKFAGNKTPPPSGPELTINPATMESSTAPVQTAPVVETPPQTIKSRSISANTPVTDEELIARSERNAPIRQEYMNRLNQPQEAGALKILQNESSGQKQLAPEFVPQAAEAITPVETKTETKTTPTSKTTTTVAETQTPSNQGAGIPEGMREQYAKGKKNPIGPSAFNHLANNLGLEKAKEVWEATYGKTNVPYEQYMAEYSKAAGKDMQGPRQPLPEGVKPGGSFGKPQYIPEYIKGGATTSGMGAAGGAALATLLAAPSIENAIQSGKQGDTAMAASHLSNLLNLHPVTSIANALFGLSPEELQTLRNAKQAKTVGGGRGVASPSAYQR
jgi:hypothetical protein